MAMIVAEVGLSGLFVRVGLFGKRMMVVLVLVMAEVLYGIAILVLAIVGHCGPGNLEREQTHQEKHKATSHAF